MQDTVIEISDIRELVDLVMDLPEKTVLVLDVEDKGEGHEGKG